MCNDDNSFGQSIMEVNRASSTTSKNLDEVYLLVRHVLDGESNSNNYEFDKIVGIYADKNKATVDMTNAPDYGGYNRYYKYTILDKRVIY